MEEQPFILQLKPQKGNSLTKLRNEGLDPAHKQNLMQNSYKNSAKVLKDDEPDREDDNENQDNKNMEP